jgi:hypothetical protein
MKKTQLIMLVLLSAICIQSCKKDETTTASTTSDKILSANINGTAWNPDTVNAAITYNDAAKTKAFTVIGTANGQRITINVTLPNSTNTNGFTLGTYKVSDATNVALKYYTENSAGSDDYTQVGTVEPGSGSVIITAIDTDKKLITGTYSFSSRQIDRDSDGNIIAITTVNVLLGSFTNLPYTFTAD